MIHFEYIHSRDSTLTLFFSKTIYLQFILQVLLDFVQKINDDDGYYFRFILYILFLFGRVLYFAYFSRVGLPNCVPVYCFLINVYL